MTIGEALKKYLLADGTIAGLVAARAYPLRLPQAATMPAIVLTRISETREQHLRGAGGLARSRYQVDSWAKTHDGAVSLGNLCRARLDGYAGTVADTTSPMVDVPIQAILFQNAMDLFEEEILGGLCRHSADYFVWHAEDLS